MARFVAFGLAAGAGLFVFRGALGYFFSQDDFTGLGRALGIVPRLEGPWRWISNQAFFDVLWALAGDRAWIWHATSLIVHGACVGLLLVLLARRVSLAAAFLGAVFFATHPALYTALYWIAVVNDSLALLFALATWLLAERRDLGRWAAVPAFILSLLSKETTILLPVVLALDRGRRRALDRLVLALAATAAAYVAYFFAADIVGVRSPPEQAAAYAVAWGPNLGQNALTYLGWTANFVAGTVRDVTDAVDRSVFAWAIALLVAWLLGLRSEALRKRGWLVGGALYAAFLVPVLPLVNHTYHYYLYAPLAGAAWCVAAGADVLFARMTAWAGRMAWIVAGIITALLTVNGAILVRSIETHPLAGSGLRADATVDRALIAERVITGVRQARPPRGTRLLFFSPSAVALEESGAAGASGPDGETYWERNVRTALQNGIAVRALVPEVTEVRFVRAYRSMPPPYVYALYEIDGRLRVSTSAEIDSAMRAFDEAAARSR